MHNQTYKFTQWFLLSLTVLVLGASFYFEYILEMQPCPLCMMQRICVVGLLIVGLLALWHKRRPQNFVVMQIVLSMGGIFFSSRQLWLQAYPPPMGTTCMPGLDAMMRYLPWQDILHALVWGTGECGEVSWQWLGLSMPGWSLIYFLIMLVSALFLGVKFLYDQRFLKPYSHQL
jgi:disulfide bond formation protein DsbB